MVAWPHIPSYAYLLFVFKKNLYLFIWLFWVFVYGGLSVVVAKGNALMVCRLLTSVAPAVIGARGSRALGFRRSIST